MSVYSSVGSSSSSSSSSSSDSSSGSTGCFSEESFSSRSTIIAPQPSIKPFGDPDYNYFWIENKSKTNPKESYYYNYKSNCVVWKRPLPTTVPLPLYSSAWVPEPKNLSDDEEDLIVSDPEDAFQKQKRLRIKQRNRRLVVENIFNGLEVLDVHTTVKSKKKLDVFWKLYRLPGETVEDVKNRLLEPKENTVRIKTEILSDQDENQNTQNLVDIPIKQEPIILDDNREDFSLEIQEVKSVKRLEEDSDSDPDNVGFLIKQEHNALNSYDSELENDSYNEDGTDNDAEEMDQSEEEESQGESDDESDEELGKDRKLVQNFYYQELHNCADPDIIMEDCVEEQAMDDDFEEQFLISDMLEIEINESDKENTFAGLNNTDNNEVDAVNWSFERSSQSAANSMLTRSVLNPAFKSSKPKPISDKKKNKLVKSKPVEVEHRRVPKLIIKKEPYYHIKQESDNGPSEQPLVYDMYGTRTTNYNHTAVAKEPRWQSCTRLSDSSGGDSDSETIARRVKQEPRRSSYETGESQNTEADALELKNWFAKKKRSGRKRKMSDGSWSGSGLSDCSDLDNVDVEIIRMKRQRRSRGIMDLEEPQAETTTSNQPLTSESNLSTTKVESFSSQENLIGFTQEGGSTMETQEKDVVPNEKPKEENDGTADSGSDSSSCCSRSSCSCSSSSSSSSSSDDENDKEVKKEDL